MRLALPFPSQIPPLNNPPTDHCLCLHHQTLRARPRQHLNREDPEPDYPHPPHQSSTWGAGSRARGTSENPVLAGAGGRPGVDSKSTHPSTLLSTPTRLPDTVDRRRRHTSVGHFTPPPHAQRHACGGSAPRPHRPSVDPLPSSAITSSVRLGRRSLGWSISASRTRPRNRSCRSTGIRKLTSRVLA